MNYKVNVIYLNYLNKDYAGKPFQTIKMQQDVDIEILEINQIGFSKAINIGMKHYFEENNADHVIVCSNDIELPQGAFRRMMDNFVAIPETGLIGIHCVQSLPPMDMKNGQQIHPSYSVFGTLLISRAVYEKVGYWNEEQDPYGINDADYFYRIKLAGLYNYYIHGFQANHLREDVGDGSEYRKMKDDGLAKANATLDRWLPIYDAGNYYLPYNQEGIYQKLKAENG